LANAVVLDPTQLLQRKQNRILTSIGHWSFPGNTVCRPLQRAGAYGGGSGILLEGSEKLVDGGVVARGLRRRLLVVSGALGGQGLATFGACLGARLAAVVVSAVVALLGHRQLGVGRGLLLGLLGGQLVRLDLGLGGRLLGGVRLRGPLRDDRVALLLRRQLRRVPPVGCATEEQHGNEQQAADHLRR